MADDGTEVTCVLDARAELGECPVWSVPEQVLYWVDIRAPALHRLDPAGGADPDLADAVADRLVRAARGVAARSWRWSTASTCWTSTPAR